MTLLISAFQVARIAGGSYWCLAHLSYYTVQLFLVHLQECTTINIISI
jgi:hypothetical protein